MKLTSLKITPKLGILVGVTLLGLCAAGVLAGLADAARDGEARKVDQASQHRRHGDATWLQDCRSRSMPARLTKEAAIAEFGQRRAIR